MAPVSRDALVSHLLATRLAGEVATPREANLRNYARFVRRDPDMLLGLDPLRDRTEAELLALMARRCGVAPDPRHRHGQDTIDPERTADALERLAVVLGETAADEAAAHAGALLGTGHPGPLRAMYAAFGRALRAAGCATRTPARGTRFLMHTGEGPRWCGLDYEERVGVLVVYEGGASSKGSDGPRSPGDPVHTHSPQPVRIALAALAESGEPAPGLVLGDHGWVCAAGRLGLRAAGFADSNDPAVFVAEEEGQVEVAIPIDDGLCPDCYRLPTAYVLQLADLSR
ncbi:phosphatase [Streptacidiphilus neutrinimicus]|uniref:phosphatase n=1 Tax=Streptacidiphilus neutrinimicus TaxID=105420 RepID=UPI0005AB2557|nr:phosphatase [Streptacidiphilus neutrinimicus]